MRTNKKQRKIQKEKKQIFQKKLKLTLNQKSNLNPKKLVISPLMSLLRMSHIPTPMLLCLNPKTGSNFHEKEGRVERDLRKKILKGIWKNILAMSLKIGRAHV